MWSMLLNLVQVATRENPFNYFQEMQFLTDFTTTSVPRIKSPKPSLSSALPSLLCSYNLPATPSNPTSSS